MVLPGRAPTVYSIMHCTSDGEGTLLLHLTQPGKEGRCWVSMVLQEGKSELRNQNSNSDDAEACPSVKIGLDATQADNNTHGELQNHPSDSRR